MPILSDSQRVECEKCDFTSIATDIFGLKVCIVMLFVRHVIESKTKIF